MNNRPKTRHPMRLIKNSIVVATATTIVTMLTRSPRRGTVRNSRASRPSVPCIVIA